jgi:hypothetical protein
MQQHKKLLLLTLLLLCPLSNVTHTQPTGIQHNTAKEEPFDCDLLEEQAFAHATLHNHSFALKKPSLPERMLRRIGNGIAKFVVVKQKIWRRFK